MKSLRRSGLILTAITLLVVGFWPTQGINAQDGGAAATISALQTKVAMLTTQVSGSGIESVTPTPKTQNNISFGNGIFVIGDQV